MTSTGVVAVDEGLLLGHPPQARVRHHRAARVRHAADGRARRRRWPATCSASAATCASEQPFEPAEDDYLVYTFNRFQACRFGLDGEIVDPKTKQRTRLRDDILRTLARVDEHALDLQALDASNLIRESLFDGNDAQLAARPAQRRHAAVGGGRGRDAALDGRELKPTGAARAASAGSGAGAPSRGCRHRRRRASRRPGSCPRSRNRTCGTARSPARCRRRR